jgi:hypothetical protein
MRRAELPPAIAAAPKREAAPPPRPAAPDPVAGEPMEEADMDAIDRAPEPEGPRADAPASGQT